MITAMDEQIGRVVAALEARQMRDNTLIIFQSDNGGTRSAKFTGESKVTGELPPNNGPYRDGKGTLYEGGTLVVAVANWIGRIKPGLVDGMLHITDMYPTLVRLAGGTLGKSKPLDGMDVWGTIGSGANSPRTEVVYNVDPFLAAVRREDWKLVWHALLPGRTELFDLPKDTSERFDLSEKNPEKVTELQARISQLAQQMTQPLVLADALSLILALPPSTPLDALEDSG